MARVHFEDEHGGITEDEFKVMEGVLEMYDKVALDAVDSTCTDVANFCMVSVHDVMDAATMDRITQDGHSRIPVYEGERTNIRGLLLVKTLIKLNPADAVPVNTLRLYPILEIDAEEKLFDLLKIFKKGKTHMALVRRKGSPQIIGLLTMEDVIEEMIKAEIEDETDTWR